jgi:hypothetical protein
VKVRQAALKRLGEKHVKAGVADAHFEVSVPAMDAQLPCNKAAFRSIHQSLG